MRRLENQVTVAAFAGLIAHWGFFIHGEHDLHAANIGGTHMMLAISIGLLKRWYEGLDTWHAVWECFAIVASYVITLSISIIVFRLLLSPLRHLPGPLSLRWTKLTHMWNMGHRQNFEILQDLYFAYGDVVRTGPNEVTIFGLDAYRQVHGTESRCSVAPFYDIVQPMVSLASTRNRDDHAHRRRVWATAFSMKSLQHAETVVYSRVAELLRQLHAQENKIIDLSSWLGYYSFDVMGLFGLNINFTNLTAGEHPIMKLYYIGHHLFGPLVAAPWLKHLVMCIPFMNKINYYGQFLSWAQVQLERSVKNNLEEQQSIIGHIIKDSEKNCSAATKWNFLLGDFTLIIFAGSDTVHHAVVNMMYYLIRYPDHQARVREELASVNINDYKALQSLPQLTAVIHETLRLHPPIPSGGLRLTPPEGLQINGTFIPGNTTIATPQYSLMRDERYFKMPTQWLPERFTTKPELILNKDAFVPWTIGRKSCPGKNLSMLEIRVAAAYILMEFDFGFAPGEDGTLAFTEASDFLSCKPGPLKVILKRRVLN